MDTITVPTTFAEQICPVIKQANEVLSHATNLRIAINTLRKALVACNDCPNSGNCMPLQELNRQIDVTIDALAIDWGLS